MAWWVYGLVDKGVYILHENKTSWLCDFHLGISPSLIVRLQDRELVSCCAKASEGLSLPDP